MNYIAAVLSLVMGLFVVVSGEERRAKLWFALLCMSCAVLVLGLAVENHDPERATLAARIVMTSGLVAACAGVLAVSAMSLVKMHPWVLGLLGAGAVANVATVWATDLAFTGEYLDYGWGGMVAGNPYLAINPLIAVSIVGYGFWLLWRNYREAHAFERNRAKYLALAIGILSLGMLDFRLHFRVDLLGGPVAPLATCLFVPVVGYACLRYRLMTFRTLAGRASGWFFTVAIVTCAYALFFHVSQRAGTLSQAAAHVGAAVVSTVLFRALGTRLPAWAERLVGAVRTDVHEIVDGFTGELMSILDEATLTRRVREICLSTFRSTSVVLLGPGSLEPLGIDTSAPVIEVEPLRRRRSASPSPLLVDHEVLVPLRGQAGHAEVTGALALGKRDDARMYPEQELRALRVLGNIFSIAQSNARRASELEKRHRLDRYLPPQIVETVLAGRHDAIEGKQRRPITTFFSDIKGFSELADRISPDRLSTVLNLYLSSMADIAFRYGGTLDKFIGDSVMVLFGAPVRMEPEEQVYQCVRMALDMQRQLDILNVQWKAQGLVEQALEIRMGIHAGEATVGTFGSHQRVEYTAVGRAVNLASRLEGKCTPGRILLSEDAFALVRHRFRATPRGAVEVKGFTQPIEVYELDPRPRETDMTATLG